MEQQPIILAFTGASGSAYGLRLLECLLTEGYPVYLMISQAGQVVLSTETDLSIPGRPINAQAYLSDVFRAAPGQLQVFGRHQWSAPVASGSNRASAMVVCPCTTGRVASIAAGMSADLIDRAAAVMLKERRKLVLVVRETPFSEIHLENMLRLARVGAVILPANPGFYFRPTRVEEIVDFIVGRVLDHLGIEHRLLPRWGTEESPVLGSRAPD